MKPVLNLEKLIEEFKGNFNGTLTPVAITWFKVEDVLVYLAKKYDIKDLSILNEVCLFEDTKEIYRVALKTKYSNGECKEKCCKHD